MGNNFWLGMNELLIAWKDGKHRVIEAYENYNIVFTGTYDECVNYCKKREAEYMESILG